MHTRTDLLARAHATWEGVLRGQPDLRAAVELQRQLITTLIHEVTELESNVGYPADIDPAAALGQMQQANPAFSSTVHISPAVSMTSAVKTLCDNLTAGGATPARTIGEHVAAGRLNATSLVGASLARDQERIKAAACQLGVAPDLLWLVAELAAGPLAFVLQRRLMASRPEIAGFASAWAEGFCPMCGSWPALAEADNGHRILRCSFCAAGWQPAARRCVYCGDRREGFAVTTPDGRRPDRQLELCDDCKGYLKVVPVDSPTPFPLLAVEDLASTDLDLAAAERGFGRPPMLRFGDGE